MLGTVGTASSTGVEVLWTTKPVDAIQKIDVREVKSLEEKSGGEFDCSPLEHSRSPEFSAGGKSFALQEEK